MTMTLSTARTVTADHLDDASNVRWSTTQLDRALTSALSEAILRYAAAGGDAFDEEATVTTNSSGVGDLSSYAPVMVRGVSMLSGNVYWPLTALRVEERLVHDATSRTLQVRLVRSYSLSTNTSDKLVSYGVDGSRTAANSFDAFDNLICAMAADLATVKDGEDRPELKALVERLWSSVVVKPRIPQATRFPRREQGYTQRFGWVYKQGSQALQMCLR